MLYNRINYDLILLILSITVKNDIINVIYETFDGIIKDTFVIVKLLNMKNQLLSALLILFGMSGYAQDLKEIQDRMALKMLVDTFSNLADTKDVKSQLQLFTQDATVESFRNGKSISKLVGHEQIGNAFTSFLNSFEVVFHQNGQQTIELDSDDANGVSYCTVTLISNVNEQRVKITFGIRYLDEYVKIRGKWYIKNRKSNFLWETTTNLN